MRMICVLAALLAAPLLVFAQEAVTFEWQGEIQADQTLEIRTINGGIRAEPAEGTRVEIVARITGSYPAPETIRIHVAPHADGILVCSIYEGISVPDYCTPEMSPSVRLENSDIRVEYTVRVPPGVALVAKTVNGRVNAHLPESAISAETVNGRVTLSTARHASARTVNGSIVASLDALEFNVAQSFRTVNGSVDVELDEAANATAHARTVWGVITTDFAIPVRRRIVGSKLDGDLNAGGAKLTMDTVNGSIHLRKQ